MSFRERLVRYVFTEDDNDLPSIAADAYEEGFASPSLAALATADPRQVFTNRELLTRALGELQLSLPLKDEAIRELLKSAALQIVDGVRSPLDGAREIAELAVYIKHDHSLDMFSYIADEWNEPWVNADMHREWARTVIEAAQEIVVKDGGT